MVSSIIERHYFDLTFGSLNQTFLPHNKLV